MRKRKEKKEAERPIRAAFTRHFMVARRAMKGLSGDLSLEFSFGTEKSRFKSELSVPNGVDRFAAVMRPFLDRKSRLNLWTVWAEIKAAAAECLSPEETAIFERNLTRLETGGMKLIWNDRPVTAREIYERLSEGGYFEEVEGPSKFLADLRGGLAEPILWMEFWKFNEVGYRIASNVNALIHEMERGSGGSPPHPAGDCLFCRRTDGGFSSEEHIFPESLAGDNAVLPHGFVCDRCNHTLSLLDEELIHFGPIAVQRLYLLPFNKKGRFPSARIGKLRIEKVKPRVITVKDVTGADPFRDLRQLDDGRFAFTLNAGPVKPDWRRLARGLIKIALELLALKQGRARACSPDFDMARRFVLTGEDFQSYLIFPDRTFTPNGKIHTEWLPNGSAFLFNIFGVRMIVSLSGETPRIDVATAVRDGIVVIPLFGDSLPFGAVAPE
jgi:hypothetical protein